MENKTILFADDDEKLLRSLKRVFGNELYETLYASSGEEVLEILNQQEVHVVLLDIMMPGLGGYETCE